MLDPNAIVSRVERSTVEVVVDRAIEPIAACGFHVEVATRLMPSTLRPGGFLRATSRVEQSQSKGPRVSPSSNIEVLGR
jgi:hypothetical protein